jgi:hypothetical protein
MNVFSFFFLLYYCSVSSCDRAKSSTSIVSFILYIKKNTIHSTHPFLSSINKQIYIHPLKRSLVSLFPSFFLLRPKARILFTLSLFRRLNHVLLMIIIKIATLTVMLCLDTGVFFIY